MIPRMSYTTALLDPTRICSDPLPVPLSQIRLPKSFERSLHTPGFAKTLDKKRQQSSLDPVLLIADESDQYLLVDGLATWALARERKQATVTAIFYERPTGPLPTEAHYLWHDGPFSTVTPCTYCGGPTFSRKPSGMPKAFFRTYQRTIDHQIPRAHGGSNAANNRVIACARCNNAKGAQWPWAIPPDWIESASHRWMECYRQGWIPSHRMPPNLLHASRQGG